jgi:serine/threonine-protein kinase RIM15
LERTDAKPKSDKLNDVRSYEFIKLISKGAYGVVWLVKRKLTGDYYAMKITDYAEKVIKSPNIRLKKINTT